MIDAENAKRAEAGAPLVVLINDSCLAFCVLLHNDGSQAGGGRTSNPQPSPAPSPEPEPEPQP